MIGEIKGQDCDLLVFCIDDSNKPSDIPTNKWVKKGEPYTIVEFCKMKLQNDLLAVRLLEIDLSDCFPYLYFNANRFGVPSDDRVLESILNEQLETA